MAVTGFSVHSPEIAPSGELRAITQDDLQTEVELTDVIAEEIDWQEVTFGGIELEMAQLSKVNGARSKLRDMLLRDVAISNCDLSNADWTGARWDRVAVEGTRLTGLMVAEGNLRDVTIQGGVAKYATFHSSDLRRVIFKNCDLSDASFEDTNLHQVRFYECNLAGARFVGAKLKEVDLRGSQIEGVQIELRSFPGVTIDVVQAMEVAKMTGARIV